MSNSWKSMFYHVVNDLTRNRKKVFMRRTPHVKGMKILSTYEHEGSHAIVSA